MTTGVFIENTPFIRIALGWGRSVQTPFVILNTGFTGDLQVTPKNSERAWPPNYRSYKNTNRKWAGY